MIGYDSITHMYFEYDEETLMNYFKSLIDGDRILLRDILVNIGVKEIPYIANEVYVIICKPLYETIKMVEDDRDFDVLICFGKCRIDFG